jgi:hypothetical protein
MSDTLQKAVKDLIKVYGEEALEGVLKDLKKVGQVNYEFKEDETYCYIDEFNKIKLVEYIAKKQLLERKLLVYSDLHGAEKMEFQYIDSSRWYIVAKLNCVGRCEIYAREMYEWNILSLIYFNTKEDTDNAIELYKDEIKEVLRMYRELYEGVE